MNTETLTVRGEKLLSLGKIYGIKALGVIAIFRIGLKIVSHLDHHIRKVLKKAKIEKSLRKFLESVISVTLKITLIVITLSVVGIEPSSFLAIFGAAGLAVGLALQGSMSNFASGVMILFFKPYKIGDFIKINDQKGTVTDIAIFNTTMITPEQKTVIIPNSLITSNNIVNSSTIGIMRVDVDVGISYNASIQEVRNILEKVIEKNTHLTPNEGSGVFVKALGDSAVNLIVRGYCDPDNYWPAIFSLTEEIKLALDQANIEIPYPQQVVHMHQPS